MNRGIETTATGMLASQRWMDVTANNLANASTIGFKADGIAFTSMIDQKLNAEGGMGRPIGSLGVGISMESNYSVMNRGPISSTGNPLDVAIETDKGLFGVQVDGQKMYTRNGSFTVNDQRQLVTPTGGLVLDQSEQPITLPAGVVKIEENGAISVDGKPVATLGLWEGKLVKAGGNMFTVDGDATPLDPSTVQVHQGALEGSNVNAIEQMMSIISIGRSFELSQKSMSQQDELTQKLIQSLQ